jgi:hypothetical protein
VGGIASTLLGGKFGHGFFSAGVTKGIGGAFLPGGDSLSSGEIAKGTVVSAVIGGIASKISGGKFANGAQTGAFQYLFNQVGKSTKNSGTCKASALVCTANISKNITGHILVVLMLKKIGCLETLFR